MLKFRDISNSMLKDKLLMLKFPVIIKYSLNLFLKKLSDN
jgi:hypothetical protein